MRILLVASWYRSPRAATRGSFIREQAYRLAARGHDVHVAYFDRDSTMVPLSVARGRDGMLTEHAIAVRWPLHRLLGFYFPWPLAAVLRRIIVHTRPDVVHAHGGRPAAVLASMAIGGLGVRFVVTEHAGPLRKFWLTRHGWGRIAFAYSSACRLVAVSETMRQNIERFFPQMADKCITISNGVDTDLFVPRAEWKPAGRLLFVGALEPGKRVDLVIGMLARIRPTVTLTIVGAGRLEGVLQRLAEQKEVASRICWLGGRERRDVAELMASHDALVLASDSETFGLVCAESLACGTPVVATRCGGPEEVIPPFGGLLVPCDDERSLAVAVEQVLDRRAQYESKVLREHVLRHFSITKVAEQLEALYRELLS